MTRYSQARMLVGCPVRVDLDDQTDERLLDRSSAASGSRVDRSANE